MRALETIYAGHRMRSRLEGKWAHFWAAMGVAWEYETEAYDLGDVRYLPDFRLPDLRFWVEIKGEVRDDRAGLRFITQCEQLALQSACPVILCFHDPFDPTCIVFRGTQMYPDARWGCCTRCGKLTVAIGKVYLCKHPRDMPELDIQAYKPHRSRLYNAALEARQYRFGFPRKSA